jgi:hypothetical protein
VTLPAGIERLWLVREGSSPASQEVEVGVGVEVDAALAPLPVTLRVHPLVQALRSASGDERIQMAHALAAALGVDGVAIVGDAGLEATVVLRGTPVPVTLQPAAVVIKDSPAETGAKPPALRWVPSAVAVGVGVALVATGIAVGAASRRDVTAAAQAEFASQSAALTDSATAKATTANILFTLAGGAGAAAVTFYFVF